MKQLLKNTIAILNPKERKKLSLLIVLDVMISIADIAFLALLLFIVHFYSQPDQTNKFSFLPSWLRDNNSLLLITLFFFLFSIKNLAGFLIYRAQSRFVCNVATRLSQSKLLQYLNGKYEDYVNIDSSVQMRKISHQPLDFSQHILGGIQQIITQVTLIILTIAAMIFFNAKLFLLLFIILLPPVIVVFYLIKNKLRAVKKYSQVSVQTSWQHLHEALSGFVESNIYNKNNFFLQRYITHQRNFNKYVSDLIVVQGIPSRMIEIFALLGLFIIIAINKWTEGADSTAMITVGAFIAAAYKIIPGIVKILNTIGQINTYSYTIPDLLPDNSSSIKNYAELNTSAINSVEFKNVCFQYGEQAILKRLNFKIGLGNFLGISGHSGKGKTTILNLLLGFLSPNTGEIKINDNTADASALQQYWKYISYVKQQPFLIHDSILHNIILDDPCDERKLQEVISAAGLTEMIDTFPEKWNKVVMEDGKNISGGQRQRIAIARALYKEADLIILDEPFNELDEDSERSLLHYFKCLSQKGKMIVLITHNQESLSFCNKIISLDEA